jgi:hypothetical protein
MNHWTPYQSGSTQNSTLSRRDFGKVLGAAALTKALGDPPPAEAALGPVTVWAAALALGKLKQIVAEIVHQWSKKSGNEYFAKNGEEVALGILGTNFERFSPPKGDKFHNMYGYPWAPEEDKTVLTKITFDPTTGMSFQPRRFPRFLMLASPSLGSDFNIPEISYVKFMLKETDGKEPLREMVPVSKRLNLKASDSKGIEFYDLAQVTQELVFDRLPAVMDPKQADDLMTNYNMVYVRRMMSLEKGPIRLIGAAFEHPLNHKKVFITFPLVFGGPQPDEKQRAQRAELLTKHVKQELESPNPVPPSWQYLA